MQVSVDCFVNFVKSRLPVLTWLPQYNLNDAISDLIAGVTVGLTVIPQGDFLIKHQTHDILCPKSI